MQDSTINTHAERCPCGSLNTYGDCCQPFHQDRDYPTNAEQLMRSRFSAFVKNEFDYIARTVVPERQNETLKQQLLDNANQLTWLTLFVLSSKETSPDLAYVEFVAFFKQSAQFFQHHERSEFIRINKRWYYQQGDFLKDHVLGRNDSCWCGSQKKLKKCHQFTPTAVNS